MLEVDIVHPGKRMYDLYMLSSSSSSYAEKMCSHKKNASLWHTCLRNLNMNKLRVMCRKVTRRTSQSIQLWWGEICKGFQNLSLTKGPFELIRSNLGLVLKKCLLRGVLTKLKIYFFKFMLFMFYSFPMFSS